MLLNWSCSCNIFNAENSVGGDVKKIYNFVVFPTESHFAWQLGVKHLRK